ncbi:MAG: acyl-CoA dehydrogenase family protein, partial [Vicinamibacterales bacterium]
MNQPGIEVRPLVQMNGSAEFCEVFLTDARVRADDVIGDLNDGWNVAKTTLAYERAGISSGRTRGLFAATPGVKAGNLDRPVGELIEHAKQAARDRSRRGEVLLSSRTMLQLAREREVLDDATFRDRVVRFHIESQVYKWSGQRTRDNAKFGRPTPASSTLKVQLAMLAHHSRDLSMSILGAQGMLAGADAPEDGRYQIAALSSYAASLGGGTNEIQRNIIGERTLGLPREPAVDTDIPFRQLPKS